MNTTPLFLLLIVVGIVFGKEELFVLAQQDAPEIEVQVENVASGMEGFPPPPSIDPLRRRLKRRVTSEEDEDDDEEQSDKKGKGVYSFLYDRMLDQAKEKKKRPVPDVYKIPGPQEPLPGRSHNGDYWPVFPFQNQFSGGLDLDPSISRHIGGDLNLAVPSWGMLDIYGRFFNRIRDTTTKFGYLNHPVNMLDLDRSDFVKLMSDPSLHWNRNVQPRLPLGKLARTYVPLNCKPPLCNPYTMTFGFGMEHDYGGNDGVEGDIDVPIPISKGVAYRFPFSGKVYYALDNITVSYGQNLAPIDPMHSLFDYQYTRDPNLAIPRVRRDISFSQKVWENEPKAKTFGEHIKNPKVAYQSSKIHNIQDYSNIHAGMDLPYYPPFIDQPVPFLYYPQTQQYIMEEAPYEPFLQLQQNIYGGNLPDCTNMSPYYFLRPHEFTYLPDNNYLTIPFETDDRLYRVPPPSPLPQRSTINEWYQLM